MKPFIIYRDKRKKFRWRVISENGEVVGASSQGFTTRYRCKANAALLSLMLPFGQP